MMKLKFSPFCRINSLQKTHQNRLVYFAGVDWADLSKLSQSGMDEKIEKSARESAETKKTDLAKRIEELDLTGKDENEVKQQFYTEADQAVEDSINDGLKANGIKATLNEIRADKTVQSMGKAKLDALETKVATAKQEARQAVDEYFANAKKKAGQKAAEAGLQQVPPATPSVTNPSSPQPAPAEAGQPADPNSPSNQPNQPTNQPAVPANQPSADPAEAQAKRDEAKTAAKAQLEGIRKAVNSQKPAELGKLDHTEARKTLTEIADLVKPKEPTPQSPHDIPDYEGWSINWSENNNTPKDENATNPTINTYFGDLLGIRIAKGQTEVTKEREVAFKLYDSSDVGFLNVDKALTLKHLKEDMKLGEYLLKAERYSPVSDKVKGAIAALLKISQENKEYEGYITSQLANLNFSSTDLEENQLLELMTLKSIDKFNQAKPDTRELSVRTLGQKAIEQNEAFSFKDPTLLKFLQNQDPTYVALDKSAKTVALSQYEQKMAEEMKTYLQTESGRLQNRLLEKITELERQNALVSPPVLSLESMAQFKAATDDLVSQLGQLTSQFNLQKSYDQLVNTRTLADLHALSTDADAHLGILNQQLEKVKNAPTSPAASPSSTASSATSAPASSASGSLSSTPSATPSSGPAASPSNTPDSYKAAWPGTETTSKFALSNFERGAGIYSRKLKVNTGADNLNVRYRDKDGTILGELPNSTEVMYLDERPANKVNDLSYVQVLFKDPADVWKEVFIAQEYLVLAQTKSTPSDSKPPETAKPLENTALNDAGQLESYSSLFNRVQSEVETNPEGSVFTLYFNGKPLPCRAQKLYDGYHLFYANQDVMNGNLVFRSIQEMRTLVESGDFSRNLNLTLYHYEQLRTKISSSANFDERQALIGHAYSFTNFPERGSSSMRLSWDGTENNNSKENPTLVVTITNRGTLNYAISNFSGPDGSPMGTYGEAVDFETLLYTLSEIKKEPSKYLLDATIHRPPW
jgi:hypothetical protein